MNIKFASQTVLLLILIINIQATSSGSFSDIPIATQSTDQTLLLPEGEGIPSESRSSEQITNSAGEDTSAEEVISSESFKPANAADYLAVDNHLFAQSESTERFDYTPSKSPSSEIAFGPRFGRGVSHQEWQKIKGVLAAGGAQGMLRNERERRRQRSTGYNPNLFHSATWACALDRITGKHNPDAGQDSPNCVEAVNVGW